MLTINSQTSQQRRGAMQVLNWGAPATTDINTEARNMCTFAAETLIFLLTGYVLGTTFYNFEWIWLAQLVGIYVFLHIIRFLGIFLAMPLLNM